MPNSVRLMKFVLPSPALSIGLFYFLSVQGYGCKHRGGCPLIVIFSRDFCLKIYFPGGKFAEFTFFGVADSKIISSTIFFHGILLSKIEFQEIYESNNYSFQGVLVFKNLVVHAPVWIKNGIAHSGQ